MAERKKIKEEVEDSSENELIKFDSLAEPMALGEVLFKSGMFHDIKSKAQAVVKILAGKELGISPIESLSNIFMVNGKVSIMAKLVGSLIKKSEKYDYKVEKLEDDICEIIFYQLGEGKKVEVGKSIFTKQDAAKAGLINNQTYKNYPRNMMFARALSNGSKWFCPDVFCGYVPEDFEEIIPEQPEVKTISMNETGVEIEEKGDTNDSETET